MPAASMPRSGKTRVCVIHRMYRPCSPQISGTFSDNGLNIENMQDKSRKEIAYTILDIEETVGSDIVDKLNAIDGVIKVRVL